MGFNFLVLDDTETALGSETRIELSHIDEASWLVPLVVTV
jgi:hypothetical protein